MAAAAPRLKSSNNLRRIMAENYISCASRAQDGKFVVWIAIGVPVDILRGFDVVVSVPENFAAASAAKASAVNLAQDAEAEGYSMDLCSYARISLGSALGEKGGLPRPDLLISCTDNSSLLVKWFDVFRREYDVPHFVLDVPFCYTPQREKDLNYILNQYQELTALLERMTGRPFNEGAFVRAQRLTFEGFGHWKRFLSFAAHRPSGITAFDMFMHMAPFITLRGTETMVEHFRMLADEIQERVAGGVFPVPNEQYRLLWDNIAPWHQIKKMSARLAEMDTNLVYATYGSCIGSVEGEIDPFVTDAPEGLQRTARLQNSTVCPYGLELRHRAMSRMIERFAIDGVVFSSNISCKPYSLMQLDLMNRIKREHNVPAVMIDLDHADVRKYSEANTFLRIEALIEEIARG